MTLRHLGIISNANGHGKDPVQLGTEPLFVLTVERQDTCSWPSSGPGKGEAL